MPQTSSSAVPQLVRFLTVGGVATVVDIGLFNGLHLGLRFDPIAAKALSTVAGAAVAFAGNRQWSFAGGATDGLGREAARYVVATAASLLVAILPVAVARWVFGLSGAVAMNVAANGIGLGLATWFRFSVYRRWVFTPPREPGVRPIPAAEAG